MTECGYTPDQIGSMTLWDVDPLFKFWSRHPPQGVLLLAIAKTLGIEISTPTHKRQYTTRDELKALVDATQKGRSLGLGQT